MDGQAAFFERDYYCGVLKLRFVESFQRALQVPDCSARGTHLSDEWQIDFSITPNRLSLGQFAVPRESYFELIARSQDHRRSSHCLFWETAGNSGRAADEQKRNEEE